jgi:hypothetical protein
MRETIAVTPDGVRAVAGDVRRLAGEVREAAAAVSGSVCRVSAALAATRSCTAQASPVVPRSGSAWAISRPRGPRQRRLVVRGGFTPLPHHQWALDRRARALGFTGLGAYLDARYTHDAHSLSQLAAELGTTIWLVRAAMDVHRVRRLPGPKAKGRARQAASDWCAAERAAALGFSDLRVYLQDRCAGRAWPLPRLADELGCGIRVVQPLLREHEVTRTWATAAQAAAGRRRRRPAAAGVGQHAVPRPRRGLDR